MVGRVVDSSGRPIKGAQVDLIDVDHGTRSTLKTDSLGFYSFNDVKPGHYGIQATAPGFKTMTITEVFLRVLDYRVQNFGLPFVTIAGSETSVAGSTPLEMTGAVRTNIDPKLVRELPLNGRSFQTLFLLTPGLEIVPTRFSSPGQFIVNGQRSNANYITIDGVSANTGIAAGTAPGQTFGGSLPALSAAGGTNSLVSTDDVQEFAIQTSSYGAEFGHMPGAQVSVVTRSGTNTFHGVLFEYLRNDALDANDWFSNRDGLRRAALRQSDFGGTLGGPLGKNKTFLFLSYEALRLRQPTSGRSDVPTIASRQIAPDPIKPFFNAYPLPTGADEGNGLAPAEYAFSNPSNLDAMSIRIDSHFTQSLAIFGRYSHSPSNVSVRGNGGTLNTVTRTGLSFDSITLGVNQLITHNLANEVRLNWTRSSATSSFRLDNFGGGTPLLAQDEFPSQFSEQNSVFIVNLALAARNAALELGRNAANVQQQVNFRDNLAWQSGRHHLVLGLDFRRLTPHFNPAVYSQVSVFNDVSSAFAMTPLASIVSRIAPTTATFTNDSAYIQDTWRPAPRVVFNYGLRWEYNPAPAGGGSGLAPFAVRGIGNPSTLSLAPLGTDIYHATKANFAPRVGLGYQLRNSSNSGSVIRAGVGIFYDLGTGPTGNAFANSPFTVSKVLFGGRSFPLTASDAIPPPIATNPPYATIVAFPNTLKQPYAYQWNVSFEQALGKSQSFTATYAGTVGHSLLRTDQYLAARLPAGFTEIEYVNNSGYSNYNGFQGQFRRRAANGLDILASYTVAHSLDNSSSDATLSIPAQFLNPASEYGPSDADFRHSGALAIDYDLPTVSKLRSGKVLLSGWSIDHILIIRSSPPVNVVVNRNIGFGSYDFRPDLLPGVPLYVVDFQDPGGRRINPEALSVPSVARQGTLGRNSFRGFPLVQADLAVRRVIRVTRKFNLQVRAEAFNFINHPNFAPEASQLGVVGPSGKVTFQNGFGVSQNMLAQDLQRGSFGTGFNPLYQIGASRSLQMAVKIEF